MQKSLVNSEIAGVIAQALAELSEDGGHYTRFLSDAFSILEELEVNGFTVVAEEEA